MPDIRINSKRQIKLGALISYAAIAFNMIAGLIYTPWMIGQIGKSNYGLYTLATSLITMFTIDFGLSAAVSRFLSKYNAEKNYELANNFLGIIYKLYLAIAALIFIILIVVFFFIPTIYAKLSGEELETFKMLYAVVGLYTVVSFPFINLNGILTSYELFIGLKLSDFFHKLFIVIAMVIALLLHKGVLALVTINAISGLLTIIIKLCIIHWKTPVKVNFRYSDRKLLKSIFAFSIWTTIAAIAQRLIMNITPSIIAAVSVTGTAGVAVFGLAAVLEGYVYTFATAINGMFMPRISRILHAQRKEEELIPLMNKIGRLQCLLVGLLTVSFISVGRSFIIDIWRKPDYEASYFCAILLILPSLFYLPMEIANTALVVENKVKLKAFVFMIMGGLNFVLSVIFCRYFGALGAAMSIFVAYMVRTILIFIIHLRVMKLDMLSFAKECYGKILPVLFLVMLIGLGLEKWNPISIRSVRFLTNSAAIVFIYGLVSVFVVFNSSEKTMLRNLFRKKAA